MQVKVIAPAFCDHSGIDDSGMLEIPESSKIKDLYKVLKIPLIIYPLLITTVNYDRAGLKSPLGEGDVVSIFWPVSGG